MRPRRSFSVFQGPSAFLAIGSVTFVLTPRRGVLLCGLPGEGGRQEQCGGGDGEAGGSASADGRRGRRGIKGALPVVRSRRWAPRDGTSRVRPEERKLGRHPGGINPLFTNSSQFGPDRAPPMRDGGRAWKSGSWSAVPMRRASAGSTSRPRRPRRWRGLRALRHPRPHAHRRAAHESPEPARGGRLRARDPRRRRPATTSPRCGASSGPTGCSRSTPTPGRPRRDLLGAGRPRRRPRRAREGAGDRPGGLRPGPRRARRGGRGGRPARRPGVLRRRVGTLRQVVLPQRDVLTRLGGGEGPAPGTSGPRAAAQLGRADGPGRRRGRDAARGAPRRDDRPPERGRQAADRRRRDLPAADLHHRVLRPELRLAGRPRRIAGRLRPPRDRPPGRGRGPAPAGLSPQRLVCSYHPSLALDRRGGRPSASGR